MKHKMLRIIEGKGKFQKEIIISVDAIESISPSDEYRMTKITTSSNIFNIDIHFTEFLNKYGSLFDIVNVESQD